MNFCGAEYDVNLDNAITTQVTRATLCGRDACVKEEKHLDSLFTDDEEDEELQVSELQRGDGGKKAGALNSLGSGNRGEVPDQSPVWQIVPQRRGEQRSDDVPDAEVGHRSMIDQNRYRPSTPTPPLTGQRTETMTSSTPSPMDLNPMSPDVWQSTAQKHKAPLPSIGAAMGTSPIGSRNNKATATNSRPTLLCPTLEPSIRRISTTDKLSERLQRGFRVMWCRNEDDNQELIPSPEAATARKVSSFLYLEADQRSLCLRRADAREPSLASGNQLMCRLLIDKILRMEIGGRESSGALPQRCFSIIANQDSKICYYDFEAGSSIERELIVSTLLVVLDRKSASSAAGDGDDVNDAIEGSEDQPIPCSPSLEQGVQACAREDAEESSSVIGPADILATREQKERWSRRLPGRLPQRRIESYRSRSSSPKTRRDKLFRQASEGYGTESHPINTIHGSPFLKSRLRQTTQDVLVSPRASPEILDAELAFEESIHVPELLTSGRARQRKARPTSELAVQPTVEDLIVEFASSGQLSPWCADDACTLALKDLADTCSNIFASGVPGQPNSICYLPGGLHEQQRMLEEYIASALGAPSAFYSYLTEGQKWSHQARNQTESTKSSAKTRFRNRSTVLNAQARRLRRLKGEMTFSAAIQKSQESLPYVQTSRSFNDEAFSRRRAKVAEEGASQFHSSVLFRHVVGSATMKPDPLPDDELVYYDSDPEDSRSQSLFRKCPRQVQAQLANKSQGAVELTTFPAPSADTGFSKVKSIRRVSKKLEEDVIIQIVQTMTNDRMTLIWHPTQTAEASNKSPLCVKVWIESGVCLLDGTFVMPKLSWTQVMDESAGDSGSKPGRRRPSAEPHYLDLLDICRVYGTVTVDRARHPFADTRKSFLVETQVESFLFETLTADERDRIVYGLKLVIARLASMLMLRDARAAEEFFGAVAPSVPGEAPAWAQGSNHGTRLPTVPDE